MYSIIDIGSNTVRLTVYQVEGLHIRSVFRNKDMTGLAGYINEDGAMSEEGLQRASVILNQYREILDNLQIENRAAFATAALRNASNSKAAVKRLEELSGFPIRLLSGKEEALLDFVGATYRMPKEQGVIVDIGGGSTEIVHFENGKVRKADALPQGSLTMYRNKVRKLIPTQSERTKIRSLVLKELDKHDMKDFKASLLCGVGGSIRGACKLCNYVYGLSPKNRAITLQMVDLLLERFSSESRKTLNVILKVVPERIHTIIPGMTILSCIAHEFDCNDIQISKYGVREGYLISEVLKIDQKDCEIPYEQPQIHTKS